MMPNMGSNDYAAPFYICGENAKIGCVVTSNTIGDNPSWKNSVIECVVAENASLHIVNCQNDTDNATIIETVEAHVATDAHYAMTTVSLGGNLVRNDANIVMKGKNAETHLYGLILGNGKRIVDNHTIWIMPCHIAKAVNCINISLMINQRACLMVKYLYVKMHKKQMRINQIEQFYYLTRYY
jgi:hypothetical protein